MDLKAFQHLRASGDFSDLIVQIGSDQLHLHRVLMVTRSDYFKGLLRSGMQDSVEVSLDSLPGGYKTMELIADFCYGIPIDERLSMENIAHVLCAASYLQMSGPGNLTEISRDRLNSFTAGNMSNCLKILIDNIDVGSAAEAEGIVQQCIEETGRHCLGSAADTYRQCLPMLKSLPINWFVLLLETMTSKGCHKSLIEEFSSTYVDGIMDCFTKAVASEPRAAVKSRLTSPHQPPAKKPRHSKIRRLRDSEESCKSRPVSCHLVSLCSEDSETLSRAFEVVAAFTLDSTSVPKPALPTTPSTLLASHVTKYAPSVVQPSWLARVLLFASKQALDISRIMDACGSVYDRLNLQNVKELQPSVFCKLVNSAGNQHQRLASSQLIDNYLNYHASNRSITSSEFCLLLKSRTLCSITSFDPPFVALEKMLENPQICQEDVNRIIDKMDFTKLSQQALERAASNRRIPHSVVMKAAVAVCSQLRARLTLKESLLKEKESLLKEKECRLKGTEEKLQTQSTKLMETEKRIESLNRDTVQAVVQRKLGRWTLDGTTAEIMTLQGHVGGVVSVQMPLSHRNQHRYSNFYNQQYPLSLRPVYYFLPRTGYNPGHAVKRSDLPFILINATTDEIWTPQNTEGVFDPQQLVRWSKTP